MQAFSLHGLTALSLRSKPSSLTGIGVFPNEGFDLPQRGVSLPPTKQATLSVRAAILPCGGRSSPLYRGLTCPVQEFDFPCTSKSFKSLQYYEHPQPKPAHAPTPSPSERRGMCPCRQRESCAWIVRGSCYHLPMAAFVGADAANEAGFFKSLEIPLHSFHGKSRCAN